MLLFTGGLVLLTSKCKTKECFAYLTASGVLVLNSSSELEERRFSLARLSSRYNIFFIKLLNDIIINRRSRSAYLFIVVIESQVSRIK